MTGRPKALNDSYRLAPRGYRCPFCLIAQGIEADDVATSQSEVVYRDEAVTALISSHWFENNPGAAIVIPTEHFENMFDVPIETVLRIHDLARRIGAAMMSGYGCVGISTRQNNGPYPIQEIWHYHLHVVPRHAEDGYFEWAERRLALPAERAPYAELLRDALGSPRPAT
ncbi:MAG: HIT family protein [Chloroflexi bacterium]|nr:HIT family protein [Chloroflexota bacterium]